MWAFTFFLTSTFPPLPRAPFSWLWCNDNWRPISGMRMPGAGPSRIPSTCCQIPAEKVLNKNKNKHQKKHGRPWWHFERTMSRSNMCEIPVMVEPPIPGDWLSKRYQSQSPCTGQFFFDAVNKLKMKRASETGAKVRRIFENEKMPPKLTTYMKTNLTSRPN